MSGISVPMEILAYLGNHYTIHLAYSSPMKTLISPPAPRRAPRSVKLPSRIKSSRKNTVTDVYRTVERGGGEAGKKALQFTVGSDPELMLLRASDNKIISSLNVLKKDKHEPIDLGGGVKMYADCTLVETSFTPVKGFEPIVPRFREVFTRMYEGLDRIEKGAYRLLPKASHMFGEEELTDERAKLIGCDPSYEAYERRMHQPAPFTDGLRTGSLHLHIGRADYETASDNRLMTLQSKENVIKLMDVFVGCSSVIICKDDSAPARRRLYGACGSFRPTPWGLEFRPLDPYALKTPELLQLIWDLTEYSMTYVNEDIVTDLLKKVDAEEVQKAVNKYDRPLAKKVLIQAGLPAGLMARVESNYNVPSFEEAWGI